MQLWTNFLQNKGDSQICVDECLKKYISRCISWLMDIFEFLRWWKSTPSDLKSNPQNHNTIFLLRVIKQIRLTKYVYFISNFLGGEIKVTDSYFLKYLFCSALFFFCRFCRAHALRIIFCNFLVYKNAGLARLLRHFSYF